MPAKDLTRWKQNEDGTWSRKLSVDKHVDQGEVVVSDSPEDFFQDLNGGYEGMTKPELEAELSSRGLPKYGNKPELIARLQENDV